MSLRAVFGEEIKNGDTLLYCVDTRQYNDFMKTQMFEVIKRERIKIISDEFNAALNQCNEEGIMKSVAAHLNDALTINYS